MKSCLPGLALMVAAAGPLLAQPALPQPVANNAVAAGRVGGEWWVFSALGIDSSKRFSGITRRAYAWREGAPEWTPLPDVPGRVGRLAATAQVVRNRLYLFGGYTVDSAGAEKSVEVVDVFDPGARRWSTVRPMPVPVDDAVSVVWRDSLIYLVSGWHDTDNVQHVQVYDVVRDTWSMATPIPGPGVFGHTGALAGNTIVYIDGAARRSTGVKYALVPQSWIGTIDERRPLEIRWSPSAAPHPGPPLYRAAAAGCGDLVLFAGGTDNPYNYNGVGYDGAPSAPRAAVMAYDVRRGQWRVLPSAPRATMDHRGLIVRGDEAAILGGMIHGQRVTGQTTRWTLRGCPK